MHTYPVLHPLLFSLPYSNSHAGRRVRHPNECPPLHGARRRPFPPLPGAVLGGSGGDGDGEAREAAVSSQVPRVLVIGLMGCVYEYVDEWGAYEYFGWMVFFEVGWQV